MTTDIKPVTFALLDPHAVKAGDRVTVIVLEPGIPEQFEVTGKAHMGVLGISVGGFPLSNEYVTLTDHQTAPEPEPVLPIKTGSVVLDPKNDMRYFRANGLAYPWVSETGTWRDDESVRRMPDVRPLVVIDPAAVDVDALGGALRREWRDKDFGLTFSWDAIARTVLAELGIEVAR